MLQPKRTKFRKQMTGHNRGLAQRGSKVSFGEFALKSVARGRLTARQIESARRALTRHVKRGGKIWIRVFPDKPISKKSHSKFGWVKVRVVWSTGLPRFSQAKSCMKSRVFLKSWRVRLLPWLLQSCRSPPPLLNGR